MTKLDWGSAPVEYHLGADRAILFKENVGVAWPGLVSVANNVDGGSSENVYLNGRLVRTFTNNQEYTATILSMSAPPQLLASMGIVAFRKGIYLDDQPRSALSFCYRKMVSDTGYQLKFYHNVLFFEKNVSRKSLGADAPTEPRSFDLVFVNGDNGQAPVTVDSRYISTAGWQSVTDMIYGTSSADSTLPSYSYLMGLT